MEKIFSLLTIIALIFVLSCDGSTDDETKNTNNNTNNSLNNTNNDNNNNNDAISVQLAKSIIPPEDTMTLDFSTYNDINSRGMQRDMDFTEGLCWGLGSLMVTWSNVICVIPLITPIAIFGVLATEEPTTLTANYVEWEYTYFLQSVVARVDRSNGEYDWTWKITWNGENIITGASMTDHSAGWWQFHDPDEDSTDNKTIKVEYTFTSDTQATLKFTNNNDSDSDTYGDYIEYELDGTEISVLFHDVHGESDNTGDLVETTVYWDTVTEAGGVSIDATDNNDDDSCTWDPNTK